MESYNLHRISKSFSSIYEDRLIPAVDLYSIADQIHSKRTRLFIFLFTDKMTADEIRDFLQQKDKKLDTLSKSMRRRCWWKQKAITCRT